LTHAGAEFVDCTLSGLILAACAMSCCHVQQTRVSMMDWRLCENNFLTLKEQKLKKLK
jgi:hypothetical protein